MTTQPAMASSCDKRFSSSYMLLNPEEVRFFDLIHILFSSDIEKRKFVDCSEGTGTDENFKRRWLIFVSILAQKFLLFVAKPLAFVGSVIEMWLNLVSINRSFFALFKNVLRGQSSLCSFFSSLFTGSLAFMKLEFFLFFADHEIGIIYN